MRPMLRLPRARAASPHPSGTTRAGSGPRLPRPTHHLGFAAAVLALAVAGFTWGAGSGGPPLVLAQVVHETGYEATVLGWTSWYGSYGMGELGSGWCIDHGISAPDAAYG